MGSRHYYVIIKKAFLYRYELFYGVSPFFSKTAAMIYRKILNCEVEFPNKKRNANELIDIVKKVIIKKVNGNLVIG